MSLPTSSVSRFERALGVAATTQNGALGDLGEVPGRARRAVGDVAEPPLGTGEIPSIDGNPRQVYGSKLGNVVVPVMNHDFGQLRQELRAALAIEGGEPLPHGAECLLRTLPGRERRRRRSVGPSAPTARGDEQEAAQSDNLAENWPNTLA